MRPAVWKVAAAVSFAALIASNLWWIYRAIDAGVTHTYREDVLQRTELQARQLLALANRYAVGRPVAEVRRVLAPIVPEQEMFRKQDDLVAGALLIKTGRDGRTRSFTLE